MKYKKAEENRNFNEKIKKNSLGREISKLKNELEIPIVLEHFFRLIQLITTLSPFFILLTLSFDNGSLMICRCFVSLPLLLFDRSSFSFRPILFNMSNFCSKLDALIKAD